MTGLPFKDFRSQLLYRLTDMFQMEDIDLVGALSPIVTAPP
jgi:hypothetical protein